jgi:glutathionyl-hydroquinone reductase
LHPAVSFAGTVDHAGLPGDTVDFTQIKQHYDLVHSALNPSGIIPPTPTRPGATPMRIHGAPPL